MNEEIKKILNLLSEGKINAEQADKLIDALDRKKKTKKLRILIEEEEGKQLLNIKIPIFLAKLGTKFLPDKIEALANVGDKKINLASLNWKEIIKSAEFEDDGELFYLETGEDNDKVVIKILLE